ncbi:MAG: acylneuraminate cytidylyltransferase family protein [Peptococcaceae bacterium]|nr:acylneuraminate cytidylyltransferase family protein [Peptococcaceae bacterium]
MINGKKVLGLITARGGSKSIPRKNLKLLAGKPLIAWTIEEALKSCYLDRLILSSDDIEIIEVARAWGCEAPFVRPIELAQDDTPGIEPVIHALNNINEHYHYIILLQPTSPLRTADDIDGCLSYCIQEDAPVCVSVCLADQNPYWMHTLNEHHRLCPLLKTEAEIKQRQESPRVYVENGAIYVARTDYLLMKKRFITRDTLAYIMPRERSWDIDDDWDFFYCTFLKSGTGRMVNPIS